jgi:hypothetical protein
MAMTEEARHELYEALKEGIGVGPANTLMDAIPPVGWADIATKLDLEHLETVLRLEIKASAQELRAEFRKDFTELQRNLFLGMIAAQTAFAGLMIGVVRYLIS